MKRLLLSLCMSVAAMAAHAQPAFPDKPIRIIVPYSPGATNDILPRLLAPKLGEVLGQPVIVENKPGAGGDIGVQYVARSAPDGYTLLLTSNATVVSAATKLKPSFSMTADFAPLVVIGTQPMLLVAATGFKADNVAELTRLAQSTTQGLTYATPGNGTPHHLAMELINANQKIRMVHVPYKGAAESLTETASGRIDVTFGTPASAGPLLADKRLKALAVAAPGRVALAPQAQTFAEAGVPGLESGFWYGITAPAAVPRDVVDKLTRALMTVLAMPDIKAGIAKLGIDEQPATGAKLAELIEADMQKWRRIADLASIRTD